MAKTLITVYEKTIKLSRRELVCEKCGTTSGKYHLTGQQLIDKWDGKPWLCHDCNPDYGKRGLKPLCVCGHRKTYHSRGKYRCKKSVKDLKRKPLPYTEPTPLQRDRMTEKEFRADRLAYLMHIRSKTYHVFDCGCKRYIPQGAK